MLVGAIVVFAVTARADDAQFKGRREKKDLRVATVEDFRLRAREQMAQTRTAAANTRKEFGESLAEAKLKAREQARKLGEETVNAVRSIASNTE